MPANLIVQDKKTLKSMLTDAKESIAQMLPRHLTPERILKMALIATSKQPKLFECSQTSLMKSIMTSAELGLDFTGTLGRAYIIPFYNSKAKVYEATFIAGYKGLIELAMRNPKIKRIDSQCRYAKDKFKLILGSDPRLIHEPCTTGDPGAVIGFYAVANIENAPALIEYMTKEQTESIRARSKAKDAGPWVTDYEQMGRKTVIRRLCGRLPLEIERYTETEKKILQGEDEFPQNDFDLEVPADQPDEPKQTKSEQLAEKIKFEKESPPPAAEPEEPAPDPEPGLSDQEAFGLPS